MGVPCFTCPASTVTPITIGSRELKINWGRIFILQGNTAMCLQEKSTTQGFFSLQNPLRCMKKQAPVTLEMSPPLGGEQQGGWPSRRSCWPEPHPHPAWTRGAGEGLLPLTPKALPTAYQVLPALSPRSPVPLPQYPPWSGLFLPPHPAPGVWAAPSVLRSAASLATPSNSARLPEAFPCISQLLPCSLLVLPLSSKRRNLPGSPLELCWRRRGSLRRALHFLIPRSRWSTRPQVRTPNPLMQPRSAEWKIKYWRETLQRTWGHTLRPRRAGSVAARHRGAASAMLLMPTHLSATVGRRSSSCISTAPK